MRSLHPWVVLLTTALPLLAWGCNESFSQHNSNRSITELGPLLVVGVEPSGDSLEIGPDFSFRITFSQALDELFVEDSIRIIDDQTAEVVAGTTSLIAPGEILIWKPSPGALQRQRSYTLTLSPDLRGVGGVAVDVIESASTGVLLPLQFSTFQVIPRVAGEIEAEALSCSSIEVRWEMLSVVDNTPVEEIFYRIILQRSDATEPARLAAVTPPGATDTFVEGLEPATTYRVVLVAVDPVGNTARPTDDVVVETPNANDCDLVAPEFSGVRELGVDLMRPDILIVRWLSATDDETAAADIRYHVYLSLAPGQQDFSVPFVTSAPGATEVELVGLVSDTFYHVVVRAEDASGNETSSAVELGRRTPTSFRADVQPILSEEPPVGGGCTSQFCHSGSEPQAGLSLETFAGLIAGGVTRDPLPVIPGRSSESNLLLRTDPSLTEDRMPLGRLPLTAEQRDIFRRWIDLDDTQVIDN